MQQNWMPERGSLVTECVRVMRLRIQAGEWNEFLPGERRLAEQLQVGRDTVRLTLAELENEGWIEPAATGCRRRLRKTRHRPEISGAKNIKIGMLSPQRLERLSQPMLLEVDHIRRALAAKGGSLEVFAPGWYESRQPGRRLRKFTESEPCAAWILHRSSRAAQSWFEDHHVPCLVRGTPHEGIRLPFLDVEWAATARHAAGILWRLGHRKIGVITPPDRLMGVEAALRGAMSLGEDDLEVMEFAENGSVQSLTRIFQRAMQLRDRPTALITTRTRQVATLLGCASRARLRVPEDLSLVSLSREPFLEYLVPEVSGYWTDPATVARQVVRRLEQLVAGNPAPGGNPCLEPSVVKGASTAPPPGRP